MDKDLEAAVDRVAKGVSTFDDSVLIHARIIDLEAELAQWRGPGGPARVVVVNGKPALVFIPDGRRS